MPGLLLPHVITAAAAAALRYGLRWPQSAVQVQEVKLQVSLGWEGGWMDGWMDGWMGGWMPHNMDYMGAAKTSYRGTNRRAIAKAATAAFVSAKAVLA